MVYRIAAEFNKEDVRELRKYCVFLAWSCDNVESQKFFILAKDGYEAVKIAKDKINVGRTSDGKDGKRLVTEHHIWVKHVVSIEDFYVTDSDLKEIEALNTEKT